MSLENNNLRGPDPADPVQIQELPVMVCARLMVDWRDGAGVVYRQLLDARDALMALDFVVDVIPEYKLRADNHEKDSVKLCIKVGHTSAAELARLLPAYKVKIREVLLAKLAESEDE